jgi:SAM-dependent methyltransferase
MNRRISGAIALAPAAQRGALALDLSAGHGESTQLLKDRGWRVVSTEYHTRNQGWVAANLAESFPFKDESFDLVTMLEVIEHLPNIPRAIGEIARVLKPGGFAIVTTPNRLNIASRIHYLQTGYYRGRRAPLPYRFKVEDGRNWNVMGLNDLHWIGWSAGLRMDAVGRSRRKLRSQILMPILYPFIKVRSWVLFRQAAKDAEQWEINRQLLRFMTSSSLLLDENIIMRFRKYPASAARPADNS